MTLPVRFRPCTRSQAFPAFEGTPYAACTPPAREAAR
jgi:hypothetical protein